jgi:hypothetical protein
MIQVVRTKQDMIDFIEHELKKGEIETFIFQSRSGKLFMWDFETQTYVPVNTTEEQRNPYYNPVEDEVDVDEPQSVEEPIEDVGVEQEVAVSETVSTEEDTYTDEAATPENVAQTEVSTAETTETVATEEVANEPAVVEVANTDTTEPTITVAEHEQILEQYKLRIAEIEANYSAQLTEKDTALQQVVADYEKLTNETAEKIATLEATNTKIAEELEKAKQELNSVTTPTEAEVKELIAKNTFGASEETALTITDAVKFISHSGFEVTLKFKD